jgi:hypothetical protein
MPGFEQMVDAERARRAENGGEWPAFCFVVDDKHHGAMRDVEAATKAIIEDAKDRAAGHWERVYVTSDIHGVVVAALRAAHPRRFILIRTFESRRALIQRLLWHGIDPAAPTPERETNAHVAA